MKIYTKTGDKGETSLFGGKIVSKSSLRIEAIGTVDELNSAIGVVIAEIQSSKFSPRGEAGKIQNYNAKLKTELEKVQNDLFEIGSQLALPYSSSEERSDKSRSRFWTSPSVTLRTGQNDGSLPAGRQGRQAQTIEKRVEEFERMIDQMTKELPELRNFILPGGGTIGAQLHLARSVCRRAERRSVELSKKENIDSSILIYFNRLSDLLFTMARFANYKEKKKEKVWQSTNFSTT